MISFGMVSPFIIFQIPLIVKGFPYPHRFNDARKLLVNVKIYDNLITFINVYAPNNENARIAFFNRLKSFTTKHDTMW